MRDWVRHFKLHADPFEAVLSQVPFYYGASYGPASLRLEQALQQRKGYILVTGEAGVGKTTLVESVLARFDSWGTVTVSAAAVAPAAAVQQLLLENDPVAAESSGTRKRAALLAMVEQVRQSGKPVVLVADDAHLAEARQLDELRMALNLDSHIGEVIQVIIVGRPRLLKTLQGPALRALYTRIATRIELPLLTDEQARDFLTDRLSEAGCQNPLELVPPDSLTAMAAFSRGTPALCVAIARESLKKAAACRARSVTVNTVSSVASVFSNTPALKRSEHIMSNTGRFALGSVAVAALAALAITVAGGQLNLTELWKVQESTTVKADAVSLAGLPGPSGQQGLDARLAASNLREKFLEGTPYEETVIKPPRRPGSAAQATVTEASRVGMDGSASAGGADSEAARREALRRMSERIRGPKQQPARAPAPAVAPAPAAPVTAVAPKLPAARELAKPRLPVVSLQVGAFRQVSSAMDFKKKLLPLFPDVYISRTDSGGEPLYRVRVGKFERSEQTEPLKARLLAAGYPSFRVSE
ncbi:MAG: AAA family ATPase [Candidatus Binatia bacterium]